MQRNLPNREKTPVAADILMKIIMLMQIYIHKRTKKTI